MSLSRGASCRNWSASSKARALRGGNVPEKSSAVVALSGFGVRKRKDDGSTYPEAYEPSAKNKIANRIILDITYLSKT